MKIEKEIKQLVLKHHWAVQVHGFYLNIKAKMMRFDVVMSFGVKVEEALQMLYDELKKDYPDFDIKISPDVDVSTTD